MSIIKEKLPQKKSWKVYDYKKMDGYAWDTSSNRSDPTTTCTTILTTTHVGQK